MPTLLPPSQQRQIRWKNGGGVTCEILRYPHDSSLESFDWRISVATVQQGGTFSIFPGIDRSLAILAGNGIALDIAGTAHQLRPGDSALQFDGALTIEASLLDDVVLDFNVMTRRARYAHTLEQWTLAAPTMLRLFSHATVLYVIGGSCTLPHEAVLQAGDAAWFDATENNCLLTPAADGVQLMLVHLQQVTALPD